MTSEESRAQISALIDALFLVLHLRNRIIEMDRRKELYKGHKIIRIYKKAEARFKSRRAAFDV